MTELALVTWRLPETSLPRLERAREAVEGADGCPGVFTFTTCQRVLAATVADDPHTTTGILAETFGVPGGDRLTGFEAFRHLARIAASLDALVPGEDQVPAQYREALDRQADHLASPLRHHLERVRAISREARDAGGLTGHHSRSIVDLAAGFLPDDRPCAILGTGTIAKQALQTLGLDPLHVVSRSTERSNNLVPDPSRAWTRETFLADPPSTGSILLATRADEARVLSIEDAEQLAQARPDEDPLVVVDLGVPRNADPAIHQLEDVRLHTLEDLARRARERPVDDEQVQRARDALAEGLAIERRRQLRSSRKRRIVALREGLADELEALAAEIPDDDGWLRRAHGRLAHAAQEHLEAALRGEPPP